MGDDIFKFMSLMTAIVIQATTEARAASDKYMLERPPWGLDPMERMTP